MSDIQRRNTEILGRIRIQRDELYESILGLERALSAPSRDRAPGWAERVSGELKHLDRALEKHITATEDPGGLFADVMEEAPRLARAISVLREEHGSVRSMLVDALDRIDAVQDSTGVTETRTRLLGLINALLEHRHHGAELVYDAYDVDIGAGD